MGWLLVFVVLSCLFFIGCSLKTLLIYILLVGVSYGFTCLFIINKWGLDGLFEEFFKAVELFGFGAPHRLENRIGYSSFYSNGSFNSLDEVPKALEEGFKKLIDNVIRDFIRTWYENVGEGELFISETQDALEMLCLEGYKRGSQIDSHYLIEQVIVVFHGHLERFNKAMAIVKAKDPKLRLSISSSQLLCQTYESQMCSKPPSLSSSAAELSYLRNVVDSLLAAMIPKDTFSCDTGRFILREILTVQVVESLVQLLTDPDWICQAVIEILRKQNEGDRKSMSTAKEEHDSLATEDHCDSLSCTNEPNAAGKVNLPLLSEKTTAAVDMQRTATEQIFSRKESEESVEDIGERIEITAPGACVESPDFRWSVSTERQPPVGESQHDSGDSFLVISVDENRENSTEDLNQGRSNWSTEVVPPSSVEDSKENTSSDQSNSDNNWSMEAVAPHSTDSMTSSSLSSSWMVCPSSEDESFRRKSFEEMKEHLSESNGALHSWKEMTMSCCHKFEASGDSYRPLSLVAQKGSSDEESDETGDAPCLRVTTRRFSLPESENKTEAHRNLPRSGSVPCNLSLADYDNLDTEEFYTPKSPRKIYSPHIYSGSFCSSSDSFKSVSSEEDIFDSYIERGEEALEESDDFHSNIDGAHSFGVVTKKSTKSKITKQVSFEECPGKHLSSGVAKELATSFPSSSQEIPSPKKAILRNKNGSSELDSIKESSWEATDRDSVVDDPSTRWKRLRLGFGGQSSDSSISDAFITASKKLVSNFKPPFKFDSFSSNSTKSSEASNSSGGESLDHSSANQREISPHGASLAVGRGRAATYTSCGIRRLSRSDAVIEESMDNSDTDTWYGTPRDDWTQEALGVNDKGKDEVDSSIMRVKRMHPSELISIPITFVALETTWEPGRNKYTLYKIEYDIRIWHEVYTAAVKQAKREAKKEQMKRRLYADDKESKEDDEEISLDRIKQNVPLRRVINRRYREFMELHNRLMSGELAVHMKDILKPNRRYNLPFGRLDPDVVEGRRDLLQNYLRSLISKPPLRNSEDLQQFLGVTEGEQISFIKPSVAQMMSQSVHVPRVDKASHSVISSPTFDSEFYQSQASTNQFSHHEHVVFPVLKTLHCHNSPSDDFSHHDFSSGCKPLNQVVMLSRQMTKVIDSIKTALDSAEEEESTSGNHSNVATEKVVVPWKLEDQDNSSRYSETDSNPEISFTLHCYSAFLEEREEFLPPTPPSPMPSSSEGFDEPDAGLRRRTNRVSPYPEDEPFAWDACFSTDRLLGPRTAGDGSDNPDELSSTPSSKNFHSTNVATNTPVMQSGIVQRERSGAIFKPFLDAQSSTSKAHKPLRQSLSLPMSRSKSMEGISSLAPTTKFTLRPQMILDAAKRIGQGSKESSEKSLDLLPTEKKKKPRPLKKIFKESTIPVLDSRGKRQKHSAVDMDVGVSRVTALAPDEPCTVSDMDQPSNLDERSHEEGASSGTDLQCPLSDSILALLCELLKDRGSWLTVDRVQQGFSGSLGGLLEWCVQSGIDDITSDDAWAFYLDKLNEAIWPSGKLREETKKPRSEIEKSQTRKVAVQALMDAFPGFFRLLIGPRIYHQTAVNVIDSLQYPQLNKILFYTLLELLFSEFVPEIQDTLQFFRRITTQK